MESPLWQCLSRHFDSFLADYDNEPVFAQY
jgi:hypothetical protein